MNQAQRFRPGQLVRWPQGHCIFRVDGASLDTNTPPVRWYGGSIVSGANMGGYVLSVPEQQLEPVSPATPAMSETGGDPL